MARFAFRSAVLLLPLVLLVGWHTHRNFAYRERLAEATAEADRLDPGWRLKDLLKPSHQVAANREGILRVIEASRLIPNPWPDLVTEKLTKDGLAPESPLNPLQAASLRADLDKARAALDQARRVADCPNASRDPEWGRSASQVWFPERRRCADLLAYDILLQVHQGDADGAVRSCQALVNVERTMNHPAIGPWPLVERARMRQVAVRRIERVLAQGAPSAKALGELQELLEGDLSDHLALLQARAQRAHTDDFWERLSEGRIPVIGSYSPNGFAFLKGMFEGSLTENRAVCLKYNSEAVEIMKLPDHIALARISALPNLATSLYMVWNTSNFTQYQWNSLAELRSAVAMLAVERYRLAHGNWPKSLNDLVPAFLREVPADPFDGKPLRYRRLPDGVVIYAVGFDGTDDGGKLDRGASRSPGFPRAAAPPTGVDVGVRLWDASRRGQPSGPKAESR
jgi:hypothetical protein